MDIEKLVARQRAFFRSGATLDLNYRRQALDKLETAIRAREADLLAALKADLGKSGTEGYLCEIG
ncbi:MAG: aldehyde dehydrogenase family protein, partial [Oscillospiraceae bacterium]|nr:aldehyde dehydrogenase family protein [Oscillospiraceae bacterium]